MSYVLENEAVLRAVPVNTSVIPAYCNSFLEASDYIEASINESFNNMMNSIGINELYVYESTGSMVIYEEDEQASKEIEKKHENFIKQAWGAIKGLFESFLKWLEQKINDIKTSIGNNIKGKLVEKLKKVPDGAVITDKFPVQYYDIKNDFETYCGEIVSAINKYLDDSESTALSTVTREEGREDAIMQVLQYAEQNNTECKNLKENLIKASKINELEPVKKDWVEKNINDIFNDIINNKIKNQIKKSYNDCKRTVNDLLKVAKRKKSESEQRHSADFLKTVLILVKDAASGITHVFSKYTNHSVNLCIKIVGAKKSKGDNNTSSSSNSSTNGNKNELAVVSKGDIVKHENAIDEIFAW